MSTLRKWYRSDLVQPVLVTLMLFQVVSGVILVSRATAARSDLYRTLQTSTGAFLAAFIVSHLNAVFILGRAVTKVDTTFLWASGAPVVFCPTRGTCGSFRIILSVFGSSSPTWDSGSGACCSLTGFRRSQLTVSRGV